MGKNQERKLREGLGISLERAVVFRLVDAGNGQDINQGGYCDARSGCVNFWCGPDDKPDVWNARITKGALNFPREFVGAVDWEWAEDGQSATLFIETTPYELGESKKRGEELTEAELRSCLDWVQIKALELVATALTLPEIKGLHCPFCAYILPVGELINDLLEHIRTAHPKSVVTGIVLGPSQLITRDDSYPLVEAMEDPSE